jgi:microcystin-dependent protein
MGDGIAFHTPNFDGNAPLICKRLTLPSFLWSYFNGVFGDLAESENWYQFGDMPIKDVVQAFANAYDNMTECNMIGTIQAIATQEIPVNMLLCDGSQYAAVDYPELAAVLHSGFIDGDNFNVPNLSGRFVLGGDVAQVGSFGGQSEVVLTVDQMPSHNHTGTGTADAVSGGGDEYSPTNRTWAALSRERAYSSATADGTMMANNINLSIANAGNGQAHDNMPPYYILRYAIIAK